MSGQGAIPSKSTGWLNPDFRGQILGKITDLGQFAELFGAGPRDFAGAIAIEGTLNARERKLGGFLTASGNSLSLFNRQIDRLTAKINLKADTIELEQFEVAQKKDFIRAQGKIDIAHESDYSGSIEAKVGDASEYFLLARAGSTGVAIPVQFNTKISSGSWDTRAAFTFPGSSPVDLAAKLSLKIGQDWKTLLASPLEATIHFPEIVPVETTLAPTIEQLQFQGDLFGSNWTMGLKEEGTAAVASIADQSAREFHFCAGTSPQGEAFNIGVHPRPQPSPPPARKQGRRR